MTAGSTIMLSDGRALAYSELGHASGPLVLWCHGGLSSRLDAEFARAGVEAAGARLVTIDRPGLGGSDRAKRRRLLDWADDVRGVADALELDAFAVVGWSGGGPHALACAARLAERVTAVAVIGCMEPVIDRDRRKALGLRVDRLLIPLARRTPWLAAGVLRAAGVVHGERAKRMAIRPFSDADRRVLEPMPAEQVLAATEAARAHGVGGLVDDYRAFGARDWGFDLSSITVPVQVWQGEEDAAIPPAIGRRLAAAIPGADLELVPDAGHFLVIEHGAAVFERLLAAR